jgi:hypothetical protein
MKFSHSHVTVFVCHASEDKLIVREVANGIASTGAQVWLDEWEIKIGDSIVEKINQGLDRMTHVIVVLSSNSVEKPWVKRELSSSLMRQLSNHGVQLLPIVLDECKIPTLLSDIKYSDFRTGLENVINELKISIFQVPRN